MIKFDFKATYKYYTLSWEARIMNVAAGQRTIHVPEAWRDMQVSCLTAYPTPEGLENVEEICLSRQTRDVEHDVLYGMDNLQAFQVPEDNRFLKSINGVLYSRDGEILVLVPPGYPEESLTLPEEVTHIRRYACSRVRNLRKVTLPEGLKSIGLGAFDRCAALEEIHIPDKVHTLDGPLFSNCKQLRKAYIGKSVTRIPGGCFQNCESLEELELPDGLTNFLNSVTDCKALKKLHLPASLQLFGVPADSGLELEEITVSPDNKHYQVIDGVLYMLDSDKKPFKVSFLPPCSGVTEVHIPEGVTTVDCDAFKDARDLRGVYFPQSLTEVGRWSFQGCQSLEEVLLPEGLQKLRIGAFKDCPNLRAVTRPGKVPLHVGAEVFSGCKSLERVTLGAVERLDQFVFWQCENLSQAWLTATENFKTDQLGLEADLVIHIKK